MNLKFKKIKKKLYNLSLFDISLFFLSVNVYTNIYYINMFAFLSNSYYLFYNNVNYYMSIYNDSIRKMSYYTFLSRMMQLKLFSELSVSDFPNYTYRLLYVYITISIIFNKRYMLQVISNKLFVTHSVTNIYPSASWFEREGFDMFGVFYLNNVDLRRILNDYGFSGHPLRKDFPLSGFIETSFDFISGVIVNSPIKMIQEYRFFHIKTP